MERSLKRTKMVRAYLTTLSPFDYFDPQYLPAIFHSFLVSWDSAVQCLHHAETYIDRSAEARFFCKKFLAAIIQMLLDRKPDEIGIRQVGSALALAVSIVSKDLSIQVESQSECDILDTLKYAFDRNMKFYTYIKVLAIPDSRIEAIEQFRVNGGFKLLTQYLILAAKSSFFPDYGILHFALIAAYDMLKRGQTASSNALVTQQEDDAINLADSVLDFIRAADESAADELQLQPFSDIFRDLHLIFIQLSASRRSNTYEYYSLWRSRALRLINSNSTQLKKYGCEQIADLICAARSPPEAYIVRNAGCSFVNGKYELEGETEGIYTYVRIIPDDQATAADVGPSASNAAGASASTVGSYGSGGERELALFCCKTRSQQNMWYLSERDEEQPGTDKDIDYYQNSSVGHVYGWPPSLGWEASPGVGVDPPPYLQPMIENFFEGTEISPLDHHLAQWVYENDIVEQVFSEPTLSLGRSTGLITFLAEMCYRYPPPRESIPYCLQPSHLLFALKAAAKKADPTVSPGVYELIVSTITLCPAYLAIHFLQDLQAWFDQEEGKEHLQELSKFCTVLKSCHQANDEGVAALQEEVNEEVSRTIVSHSTAISRSTRRRGNGKNSPKLDPSKKSKQAP